MKDKAKTATEELERLAADARMLEDQGELSRAREKWVKALERLPAESRQASWIKLHSQRLELAAGVSSARPTQSKRLGRFAPLAPILVALTKGKALLALFNLKFLLSLGAFVGVYWSIYGMKFGDLSRKTKPRQGRKTVALDKSFAPAGASFCQNGNHGLQPWLYSDAAPRLFSSHPHFLDIGSSEIERPRFHFRSNTSVRRSSVDGPPCVKPRPSGARRKP